MARVSMLRPGLQAIGQAGVEGLQPPRPLTSPGQVHPTASSKRLRSRTLNRFDLLFYPEVPTENHSGTSALASRFRTRHRLTPETSGLPVAQQQPPISGAAWWNRHRIRTELRLRRNFRKVAHPQPSNQQASRLPPRSALNPPGFSRPGLLFKQPGQVQIVDQGFQRPLTSAESAADGAPPPASAPRQYSRTRG